MKSLSKMHIKQMEIDSHIGIAPMCTYLCDTKDGVANEFHFTHYGNLALGNPGFIIQEATSINDQGYISDHCLGIYKPRQKEALAHLVDFVHKYNTKIGVQLNHAGIKSRRSNITKVGPSAIEDAAQLSEQEIIDIVNDFAAAAKSARNIGYDFIEVHSAHGYLLNQFLSPLTNKRQDRYGQDRFLLLKEVVLAVQHEFDGPIFVRISADEYNKDGNGIEQSIETSKKLEQLGVSLINVSSGAFDGIPFDPYPLYQVKLAQAIKENSSTLVATAGLITTIDEIEEIISSQQADVVLLGRKALVDPYFVVKEKYKHGLIQNEDVKNYMYRGLLTQK